MKAKEAHPSSTAEWVSPPVMEVTAEQLAQVLACSAFNVRQLAVNGVIRKTAPGRYPLFASIRSYCEHMRALATGRGEGTPAAEKRRFAKAQADMMELKMKRLSGELLSAADVKSEWISVMSQTRARLLAVSSRIGAHLTAHDLAVVDAEIREALSALADGDGKSSETDRFFPEMTDEAANPPS